MYSIGYKMKSGSWAYRYDCPVTDGAQVAKLRRKAILESANVHEDAPVGGFSGLVDAWFKWQEKLPASDERKRKDSTIAENKREAANLKKVWGHLEVREVTRTMAYDYLEACLTAQDKDGNPRPRPEKGNKEIALARLIMEFAVRKGVIEANPLDKIQRNKTTRQKRKVSAQEMNLAVEVGRRLGGAPLIVALGLRTAWLCVRRSVEVRAIQRQAIREDGILWHDGKDDKKAPVLIEWSDELRATIAEALTIKRSKVAGTMYVFGNLRHGTRYTKGGWKSVLDDLMTACVAEAAKRKIPFRKFSLQDCRPMGVSDKLEKGHGDVLEATGHVDRKMVERHYDRREHKRATPAA